VAARERRRCACAGDTRGAARLVCALLKPRRGASDHLHGSQVQDPLRGQRPVDTVRCQRDASDYCRRGGVTQNSKTMIKTVGIWGLAAGRRARRRDKDCHHPIVHGFAGHVILVLKADQGLQPFSSKPASAHCLCRIRALLRPRAQGQSTASQRAIVLW
jgi:hypothetical protein